MTAFIAAENREFIGLRRHLLRERSLGWKLDWAVSAELNGASVILAVNGPGPKLAEQAVQTVEENLKLGALVSYGFCGALDPALAVNDVFVASEIQCGQAVVACLPPSRKAGMPVARRMLSIDRVASTASEKAQLRQTGASAVDMEAGALASHAQARRVPFYCIRVVTDSATEDFAIDFNQVRNSAGRFSRFKILAQAARTPLQLVPKLIQLNQRAKAASITLGDFVASCQF